MSDRHSPHETEHRESSAIKGDRIRNRPVRLAGYLAWLTTEYALEAPQRLHDRDVADDGAPDQTGEMKSYIGFSRPGPDDAPDDWRRVACRLDGDGSYATPMRCAIEQLPPARRRFVRDLATNVLMPTAVLEYHGIPDWAGGDVMHRSLTMLWDKYAARPLARRSGRSEAQLDAEAA